MYVEIEKDVLYMLREYCNQLTLTKTSRVSAVVRNRGVPHNMTCYYRPLHYTNISFFVLDPGICGIDNDSKISAAP